ncbi:dna polymerase iv [Leptolyngbya sp. Heron Island J]|uniref:DNA polymerase IV n=1 Tax=Leptolyngbya sp. Heron Island J TaxID=1385935 RepID=UPI0003B99830|nr:DNA polymerase IV [Leptolyngbya sp. Heron Island J]ESA38920.1 dna polymerase iv [Leptolyngbya sp. Heron Island J]
MTERADHRKILHVDMDAFYASIEQRDHVEYRDQPVVVGGRPEQRGAVAAASYEARRYGIHSAMPSRIAIQRCPHVIFVRPRFDVYRGVSEQIRTIFRDYTELVEPLSLDEAYLDVTGCESAIATAKAIKQRITQTTELTASAGVSINKFLAKMASDVNKPDGLYVILPDDAMAFIATLPIEKFHGIGPATARKMKQLGIVSGADLQQWSETDLVAQFGKVGHHYFRVANAQDNRRVDPNRIRKSIGAERSFAEDLRSLEAMSQALATIVDDVEARLLKAKKMGYTLTLKIKYANYHQITRSRTVDVPMQRAADMGPLAQALLEHHLEPHPQVRLLGVAMANLVPAETVGFQQLSLL